MSGDFFKKPRDDRYEIISDYFKSKKKSKGGDPSLSGQQPRGSEEFEEQYDRYDDQLDPEGQEFLQTVLAWQNRADLGEEGRWPSGEAYPTDEDLEWMFNWIVERPEGEQKGISKLLRLKPPGNEVDDRYRADIRSADINSRQ